MNGKARLFIGFLALICLAGLMACGRDKDTISPQISDAASEDDLKLGLHTTDAVGEKEYVVILADFPDVERQFSEETMAERLLGFVSTYYYESSYKQLTLNGEMTRRVTLPYPVSHYRIASQNLNVDPKKVFALVSDAVNAADEEVEFSEYQLVIIALGASHKEYGMIGLCAVPGMLGFQMESPITTDSGEIIHNAAIFSENAHLGTYLHDTLHMIGGVKDGQRMTPCLYDHDLQAIYTGGEDLAKYVVNMGFWDPLSSHIPYDMALPPTGLSSWTKLRLGWINPSKIALVNPGETATIKLDPLVSDNASTQVIKIPLSKDTYYLIENRPPIESDAYLPSSGVLILYADDRVLECRHGNAPVRMVDANPSVPYLNDAAFDIGKRETYIDTKNNVAIILLEEDGMSYKVRVTTPDQVTSR